MNTAINHNNLGVSCLQKGSYQDALVELKKAAQLMYSTTQELKESSLAGPQQSCHVPVHCKTHECSVATNNSFIRSTPMIMTHIEGPATSCTVESATVLMNMALCYHLDSAEANRMPDAMHNALTIYQMAYSLGVQAHGDERAQNLILTSLNNLGQLHHEMGDFEKSGLYLEDLASYVAFINERGSGHLVEDRHEFMLNAMVLGNPNSCAGAA